MAEKENLPQPELSIPDDQKTSRAFQPDEPAPLPWVSLPSGTVTFLFTDIEGSTPLWERNPQAMKAALQAHHTLLTRAIEYHQGVAFKCTGDGIEAAFPLASQALLAALDAQHILAEAEWNELGPLKVRMGLHTGEAQPDLKQIDYFTPAAPRAQRVMSAGHGGQILLSQETADLCRHSLPEGVSLKDLGLHHLKGLPEAERIFQVVAPGMRLEFPRLKTLDRFPHNLPVQLTSFIGREKETAEVLHLLNNTRLLTLSGVGGTGKTRLGLHVAGQVLDDYEDGAWLVELAKLTDPALILPTVAAVFGFVKDTPEMPLEARLHYHLHDKNLLLILDNCEHLIQEAAHFVDHLLHASLKLKVLVTSREALGIGGETIYLVPSLALPDPTQAPDLKIMAQVDAIRLFLERAQAVQPGFELNETNVMDITQVCATLDGIPLAIELAAARVKVFSTRQILERLDQRFRLLTGGSRVALPRQQTLQAAIDWSYNLLSEPEKILLRSLSVFVGGFTLEAVEAVCDCEGTEIHDGLAMLVNKSLVEAERVGGEVRRYHLLETMRQYALEKLVDAGESTRFRERHLAYYIDISKHIEQNARYLKSMQLVKALKVEISNFRAALSWAFSSDNPSTKLDGLQLACNLNFYWSNLNLPGEGYTWVKKGLVMVDRTAEETLPFFAKVYAIATSLADSQDNNHESFVYAWESLQLFRKCKEADFVYMVIALMYHAWGIYYLQPDQPKETLDAWSKAIRQEGIDLAESLGVPMGLIYAYLLSSWDAMGIDPDTVIHYAKKSSVILLGTDYEGSEKYHLGVAAFDQGEYTRAVEYFTSAIENARKNEMIVGTGLPLMGKGDCAFQLNQMDLAWECYYEAMTLARAVGKKWVFLANLRKLSEISLVRGQRQQAVEFLEQGLDQAAEIDDDLVAFHIILPLLNAAEGVASPEKMARLFGYIMGMLHNFDKISERTSANLDRIKEGLQARLSPEIYHACLEAGRNLTYEQATAEARLLVNELRQNLPAE